MIFILKNWKILLGGGVVLILVGLYAITYYKAYHKGYNACQSEFKEAKAKAVENRDKIEQSIITLPKAEVQKRLEQKWCRDCL